MTRKILNIFLFVLLFTPAAAQQKDTLKLSLTEKVLPFGIIELVPNSLPKIGLALSGGGARALSQIGILRSLEENDIPIEFIVGTSMGSIIGGLYSSGYSIDDIDSILSVINWGDLFSVEQSSRNELFIDQKITEDRAIVAFRMDGLKPIIPKSISSGQRAANFLNLLSLNAPLQPKDSFDDLLFKYRAVSSDLVSGKEIILDKEPLGTAMQASSSVTLLLPPVKHDSLLLVDGGLVANIPAKETRNLGAEIVVAGNAVSPLYQESELNYPWVIADQLVSIPMQILNDQQLQAADFVIQPKLAGVKNSDFANIDRLIKEGNDSCNMIIDSIRNVFERKFKQNLGAKETFYKNVFVKEAPPEIEIYIKSKFTGKDSISNKEILFELYKLQKESDFKNIWAEIEQFNSSSYISFFVEKYPVVLNYSLLGDSVLSIDVIHNELTPLLNKSYNPTKVLSAGLKILRHYKKMGYLLARINKLNYNETSRTLEIEVDEGRISNIRTEGNTKTIGRLITREFPMNAGDYFLYDRAERGLANLRSSNLFEQIELLVERNGTENNLIVRVMEKPSSVIRFGMRIDNEYLSQLSFDLRDENFNGTGTELGATISGGIRNRSYVFEFKSNRVFDSYLTYKVRGFYEFVDINTFKDDSIEAHNKYSRSKIGEYRQINIGGSIGIGAQVKRFGNLFIEARYQSDQIKNKVERSVQAYKIDISSIKVSLSIDSQNDYPYPTDGFLIKSTFETAQEALGGDVGYSKFLFDYKSVLGLNAPNAFTYHGIFGFADKTLPLSQQFSLGGQNNFYGLRENEYRGRQILVSSLEYRHKLPFQLFFDAYVKVRYDLGSIWTEREQIRLKDLRHGIGASVSLNTPVGPADFSVGKSFYLKDTLPNNTVVWGPTFFYFTIGYYY